MLLAVDVVDLVLVRPAPIYCLEPRAGDLVDVFIVGTFKKLVTCSLSLEECFAPCVVNID